MRRMEELHVSDDTLRGLMEEPRRDCPAVRRPSVAKAIVRLQLRQEDGLELPIVKIEEPGQLAVHKAH